MKNRFLKVGIILLLQLLADKALGQIPVPPSALPSPNAASLGLYGDYPVSHFTGIPQIGIPLYDLEQGHLRVPISLHYHASGARPDQHPGWVGMGWSLRAGGVVTRSVNDLPDEYNHSSYHLNQAGFYYNHSVLNRSDWNSVNYLQTVASDPDLVIKDTEPDEFSFTLPDGTTGKFFVTHTGSWNVRCDRPVKVKLTSTNLLSVPFNPPTGSYFHEYGYFKTFSGFVIIDEYGVEYTFGTPAGSTSTNAIEYSTSFFQQYRDTWTATSWFLVEIKHPYNDVINLTYERDNFIAQMYLSLNQNLSTKVVSPGGFLTPACGSSSYIPIDASYQGMLVSPVYLTKISAGSRDVKFVRTNTTELRYQQRIFQWKYWDWTEQDIYPSFLPFLEDNISIDTYPNCLNKLQWKQLAQILIEEENQTQKYFVFTYSNNIDQRLTLYSLTERGEWDGELKPYIFSYYTPTSLPEYVSNRTDHWGYYNGTFANVDNINNYYLTYFSYKQPKEEFLLAGTLNRIMYPTGGVTYFEYEPHDYMKQVSVYRDQPLISNLTPITAGGLRIQKITSYDPLYPEQKIERKYTYNGMPWAEEPLSTTSSGVLGGEIKYYFDDYRVKAFGDPNTFYSQAMFSSQSVYPGNYSSNGNHIGYSEVVETLNDGSYTRYLYSNYDLAAYRDLAPDNSLQPSRMAYEPYTSMEMNRGKLLRERSYSSLGVLLKERELTYIQTGSSPEVRAMKASSFTVCDNFNIGVIEGTAYRFLTHSFLPATEKTTEYDMSGSNPLTTTRTMSYDNTYGKLLREELVTDSKGLQHRTNYRYPFDVSTGSSNVDNPYYKPILALKNGHIIGRPLEVVWSTVFSGGEFVTGAEITTYKGSLNNLVVTPFQKYVLKTNINLPKSSYVSFTANANFEPELNTVDSRLTVVEEYIFGGQGRTRLLGVSELDGPWRRFIWGYDHRHITAIVENGDANASYTGFESSDQGGWVYNGTTFPDYSAPSGTWVYTLSSGSLSKSGLNPAKSYLLSYWAKSPSAGNISGGDATAVRSYNGWTLYKRKITGVPVVTLTGTMLVDDIRLHPSDATMTSYTFNIPGKMSSETDGRGNIQYYQYDQFHRLLTTKNHLGNIIKTYDYKLFKMPEEGTRRVNLAYREPADGYGQSFCQSEDRDSYYILNPGNIENSAIEVGTVIYDIYGHMAPWGYYSDGTSIFYVSWHDGRVTEINTCQSY